VLTLHLRERRDLAVTGFIFYALASMSVVVAAAMSGLVFPAVLRGVQQADAPARVIVTSLLRYTGLVNQAFAAIYVVFTGIAILLWSSAMLASRHLPRALAHYGLVLGVLLVAGVLSGHLALGIHGFGAVVLGVGIWMMWSAHRLWGHAAG
jgi:hypothetical protein